MASTNIEGWEEYIKEKIRKLIIVLFLFAASTAYAQTNDHYTTTRYDIVHPQAATPPPVMVYVCNSSGAYRYHSRETCTGYRHCRHTESQIDIAEAKKRAYTPCKICKPQ